MVKNDDKVKMRTKEEWSYLNSSELKEQISLRKYLIESVLIGNLYPSILQNEILELKELYKSEGEFNWPCPCCDTQLEDASGGGVKCPNPECGYWFCF